MTLPPGMYTLRPETRAQLRAAVPFPAEWLYDRDDMGRGLTLVDEAPGELLFRFNAGALLRATVRAGQVVAVDFHEGQDAVDTWIARGMRLPEPLAATIRARLVPGAEVEPALVAVWGPRLRLLAPLRDERAGTRRSRRWRVDSEAPYRTAVLEVDEEGGRVVRARLLEGRPGWDAMLEKASAT